MLKKNCHYIFGSQKSKLTLLLELAFQTAGVMGLDSIRAFFPFWKFLTTSPFQVFHIFGSKKSKLTLLLELIFQTAGVMGLYSIRAFFPFWKFFVHLTSSGFAYFCVGCWWDQGKARCGGKIFLSLFEGFT